MGGQARTARLIARRSRNLTWKSIRAPRQPVNTASTVITGSEALPARLARAAATIGIGGSQL